MPFIAPIVEAGVAAYAAISAVYVAAGVIGQAVIMAGIGIAATYIISALTPKPQNGTDLPSGVQFQTQYGASVPRQVACGLVGIAGHDTYVNTFNPSNRTLQKVFTISDYPVTALTRVAIDGVWVTLGPDIGNGKGSPVISGGTFGDGNSIWIKLLNGRQTTADSFLTTFANPAGRFSANNVGFGIAAVSVLMEFNKDTNNSMHDFFFEFQGAPLYDPRKDSTVGGSGSHRWGDITTHQYSANPIVIEYNYRRGFSFLGDLFCGMDMPPTDLPLDKFFSAMNICDEVQSDGFARYECSIMLNCMSPHSDNLQSISLSCGSMQIDGVDGSWPLVGSDQAVVATFTDDDIVSLSDTKYSAKKSMSLLVNSISGNYPEPALIWSMIGYDEQTASSFLVLDRRTRDLNMDFPQVRRLRQADQLAQIYLFENRFEATGTVTLRPSFQRLEAGDWVNWNSARYGLKTYIVTGTQLVSLDADQPRNITLSLQQRDGSIYNGVTPALPTFPFPPGDPVYMSEVASFAVLPISVQGDDGLVQAGIRASWFPIDDVTVTQVDIMYFPVSDPTSVIHKIVDADVTVAILAEGIVGNTLYRVQARILTNPTRTTVFNAGVTLTTLFDVYSVANFDAGTKYQVTQLLTKFDDRMNAMEQLIETTASNQNARQWNNKQMVQRQIMAVSGSASASITEVMTVAVDSQLAFASYQLTVAAEFNGVNVSVAANTTAIAGVNGLLVASWSITLNVAGHISGLKQLNDGTLATFVIETNVFQVSNPAAFGGAAQTVFTLQTVSGVTQMALRGDFVADGVVTARMIIAGGINAINIIAAGTITAASGVIGALSLTSLVLADNAVTVPQTFTTNVASNATTVVGTVADTFVIAINTAGLAGKTITVQITFFAAHALAGGSTWNTLLVAGGTTIAGNPGNNATVGFIALGGVFSFSASGGVDNLAVSLQHWASAAGASQIGLRTLTAVAVKR